LKKPDESEQLIEEVLKTATTKCDNPDLRDRAFIYWRMLSSNPQQSKLVVLCEKPSIDENSYNMYDDELLEGLIE
jgi:vesicle coat complex subunit